MNIKDFHKEATKLGYSKREIVDIISTIENLEEDGVHAGYELMLVERPTSTPVRSEETIKELKL